MSRREILKNLRRLEIGCRVCTKPPKNAKRDGCTTWCRENCPVMQEYAAIGAQLITDLEQRRAERAIERYRRENEMRPAAATADLEENVWQIQLAVL